MRKEDKVKAIQEVINKYNRKAKRKGEESVIKFGKDFEGITKYCRFGISTLDEVVGGVPCGQFTVIAGPEKAGKSSLCAKLMENVQKRNGTVVIVDAEHQLDKGWLTCQGVNVDDLLIIDDSFLEPTLDKVRDLLATKAVNLLVVDSISALGSLQELQDKKGMRSMEDNTIAVQARKISQFFRMSVGLTGKAKCAVVLIAQIRTNIMLYGNLETIPGGKALEHYCSLRLRVRRGAKSVAPKGEVNGKEMPIGFRCIVKLDKKRNVKSAMEGTEVALPFYFDKGFTGEAAILKGQLLQEETEAEKEEENSW